jgi:hypothetical protein
MDVAKPARIAQLASMASSKHNDIDLYHLKEDTKRMASPIRLEFRHKVIVLSVESFIQY